jgi:hypothetical protein
MRGALLTVAVLATAALSAGAEDSAVYPFESETVVAPGNVIDQYVALALKARDITPARACSDEVFVRRAYLDVIGALPQPVEVRDFLAGKNEGKRAALIDDLLAREEFADYQAMKWCDVLRVKAEFPINLWPNAVQAYHHWIRESIKTNKPYDQFAFELLTSSGSCFRVPPVNFYRAVQSREPSALAEAVALTFMGERIQKWPEDRRAGMAALFSRVRYKTTAEWKEEIVYLDPEKTDAFEAVLPDGTTAKVPAGEDARLAFARWLISKDNPRFIRGIANRVWAWIMGRGIIHEADDIRADNPPSNPALLACLERELARADFDLKALYRLILNSRTYQQSSIPRSNNPQAAALFAYYPVRRVDAEVLIDALCHVTGTREGYSSPIPEPFTFIPEDEATVALADGSISSTFLETFGRPPRDTGLESERSNTPTDSQRLHLLNSTHVRQKIERGPRIREIIRDAQGNRRELVTMLYLTILSRYPTQAETGMAEAYFGSGTGISEKAANDIAWALVNSKEFLYRH